MNQSKKARENKLGINLVLTLVQVCINYGISFLFTPYLIKVAGSEAYGFVNMANNMVNYATLITVALNSVAGRYITISIHKGNSKEGNEYFNSVIWTNVILGIMIGLIFIPIICNVDKIFDVPMELLKDVKLLFVFVVINFVITVVSNVLTVGAFIVNSLYISSIGNCISSVLRVILLVTLFGVLPANVAYVGLTSVVCSLFLAIYNGIATLRMNIGLSIDIKIHSIKKIKELFLAGIWSSVTKLSQILSDGLDLVISNMAISASAMGSLSVAYTVPSMISGIIGTISSVFCPQQMYYYAKNDTENLVKEIKSNMQIIGFFSGIILVEFVAYGREFFSLWIPNQDIQLIYELSIISCISMLVTGVTSALNNVFLITNNLKENSLFYLGISILDAVLAIILVSTTDLGIYAVAGVSKVVGFIVNVTYVPLYSAKCLKVSWKTFYRNIIKYLLCVVVLFVIVAGFKKAIFKQQNYGWLYLFMNMGASFIVVTVCNMFILLDKHDRRKIMNKITKK